MSIGSVSGTGQNAAGMLGMANCSSSQHAKMSGNNTNVKSANSKGSEQMAKAPNLGKRIDLKV